MDKKKISKEEIVAEYLTGNISYRALEKKYGVPSRSICDWVLKYQGRLPSWKEKERRRKEKLTGKQEIELWVMLKIMGKIFILALKKEFENIIITRIFAISFIGTFYSY